MELRDLGSMVAAEWDGTYGVPVQVRVDTECWAYWSSCAALGETGRPSDALASVISAFALALHIPRVDVEESPVLPHCRWSEAHSFESHGPSGLRVRFIEPRVFADSVRIMVASECRSPDRRTLGFRQTHEFVFGRAGDGAWALLRRRLILIT